MTMNNGYAAYQNSKIMTASPAELTLMLYEGAIKFCNIAIMGIEENNIQKAHTNIVKVENIIEEFQATLNHQDLTASLVSMSDGLLMIRKNSANITLEIEEI